MLYANFDWNWPIGSGVDDFYTLFHPVCLSVCPSFHWKYVVLELKLYFLFWFLKSCANFHSVIFFLGGGCSNTLYIVQWFNAHVWMFCSIKHELKLCYFELQYFKSIKVTESCAIFILKKMCVGGGQMQIIYIKIKKTFFLPCIWSKWVNVFGYFICYYLLFIEPHGGY